MHQNEFDDDKVALAIRHDEEMREDYEESHREQAGTPIVCVDCAKASLGDCTHIFFVNVYEAGREYGGPEEGGWYYDTGVPVLSVPVVGTRETAWRLAHELREGPFPRTGKRGSVLGGEDFDVTVHERPGEEFPKETPHYE